MTEQRIRIYLSTLDWLTRKAEAYDPNVNERLVVSHTWAIGATDGGSWYCDSWKRWLTRSEIKVLAYHPDHQPLEPVGG